MLEMAQSKKWDLKTINISGSDTFKEEVQRQIDEILNAKEKTTLKVRKPTPGDNDLFLNSVKQETFESKEQDAKKQFSNDELTAFKTELDAERVLNYAIDRYDVIAEHFTIIDNKIDDDRTRAKPKGNIDFLTKTCNVSFADALPILEQLLEEQRQSENDDMGMRL